MNTTFFAPPASQQEISKLKAELTAKIAALTQKETRLDFNPTADSTQVLTKKLKQATAAYQILRPVNSLLFALAVAICFTHLLGFELIHWNRTTLFLLITLSAVGQTANLKRKMDRLTSTLYLIHLTERLEKIEKNFL